MPLPLCHHLRPDGSTCRAIALRGELLCFFHNKWRSPARRTGFAPPRTTLRPAVDIPPLNDRDSIQLAVTRTIDAVSSHALDGERARVILYALQIAAGNLLTKAPSPPAGSAGSSPRS